MKKIFIIIVTIFVFGSSISAFPFDGKRQGLH